LDRAPAYLFVAPGTALSQLLERCGTIPTSDEAVMS
jgi:hypothetical protein